MAHLIGPEGLEADAVVPQCLDNQYVSDSIFADMVNRRVDFRDQVVADARERDFRTEFIRSLIYSSQVVIQRAFFKNSDFLRQNYRPERGRDLVSFAQLIRDRAIVPFLLTENALGDDRNFSITDEGNRATRILLEEVGDDFTCVRLSANDAENARAADAMISAFGYGVSRVNNFSDEQMNAMAAELFADPTVLQADGAWDALWNTFDDFSTYTHEKMRELRRSGKIGRQDIYQDLFMAGDSPEERRRNVALGRFKAPGADAPYLLELKKFVDLVYNSNLPDHLKRYTFTPSGLPSRMALQDAPGIGFRHDDITASLTEPEVIEAIARRFQSDAQKAMTLPLLSSLTVSDVVAIRALPEWYAFKEAQTRILKEPLRCLELMPQFQQAFGEFQAALSDWYNVTYQREKTLGQYVNFVSIALSVGGALILAGQHIGEIPHEAVSEAIPGLVGVLPRTVKGYAAKLMVGVYDRGKRRLDKDRSYTIELMQTQEELSRDEITSLINAVTRDKDAFVLPAAGSGVADQGVE